MLTYLQNVFKLAARSPCPFTRDRLAKIGESFDASITQRRLSVLDILEEYPAIDIAFGTFLSMLPPMRPRQYSIASSPLADPTIATLMWTVLDSEAYSGSGRRFLGVCSTYLSGLTKGDRVHVNIKPALRLFHTPSDPESMPIIMACAGTGLAPFRGFLEERAMQSKRGLKLAPAHLFIGCRSPEKDALLKEELSQWEAQDIVRIYYAFSKTSGQSNGCKYVQDRIWSERALIKRGMLQGNSRFLVCGGGGVGRSVEDVMKRIYKDVNEEEEGKAAESWFQGLKANRYVTEIFS